jgi:hypothetical protein
MIARMGWDVEIAIAAIMMLAGCGPRVAADDGGADMSTTSTSVGGDLDGPTTSEPGSTETSPTSGIDSGDGPPAPPDCSVTAQATTIDGITMDVLVTCPDAQPDYGLAVAPGADSIYVVAPSYDAPWVLDVDGEEARVLAEGLPLDTSISTPMLAQDPMGDIAIAIRAGEQTRRVEVLGWNGEQWSSSIVVESEMYGFPLAGHEIASDGSEYVWYESAPPSGMPLLGPIAQARRSARGWDISDVDGDWGSWGRYALDRQGRPVLSYFEVSTDLPTELQLHVIGADFDQQVGPALPFYAAWPAVVMLPTNPVAAAEPTYVVAQSTLDSVVVSTVGPDGVVETLVPDTPIPQIVCNPEPPCPAECTETATGVQVGGFGLASSTHGSVWIAYVTTTFDITYDYMEQMDPEVGSYCVPHLVKDASVASFHLARVEADGSMVEMVSTETSAPAVNQFPDAGTRWLDMRSHADSLAVAWFDGFNGGVAVIRALLIDATLLTG